VGDTLGVGVVGGGDDAVSDVEAEAVVVSGSI